jgi:ATP-dependent Zn protease
MIYVFNNLNSSPASDKISYSEFQKQVVSGNVEKVIIKGDQQTIVGTRLDGTKFETIQALYKNDELVNKALQENKVTVVNEKPEQPSIFSQLLVGAFPDMGPCICLIKKKKIPRRRIIGNAPTNNCDQIEGCSIFSYTAIIPLS